MKYIKTILILIAVYSFGVTTTVAHAPVFETPISPQEYAKQNLHELIDFYSKIYNVSAVEMKRVIGCESGWNPAIQSQHKYTQGQVERNPQWNVVAGEQERSFGLVQIHLPAHPTVTVEMATDPDFAVEFMAKAFSRGKQSWWTCY